MLLKILRVDTHSRGPATAVEAVRCTDMRTDGVRQVVRTCPALQSFDDSPYVVLRRSLHHFTLHIGDNEDKVSTHRLKPCTDTTVPPAQPRTMSAFEIFPRRVSQLPPGYILPTTRKGTTSETAFPWPVAKGFCTPRRRSSLPSARMRPPSTKQTRPLDLQPRDLGEPCGGYETPSGLQVCYAAFLSNCAHPHASHIHDWRLHTWYIHTVFMFSTKNEQNKFPFLINSILQVMHQNFQSRNLHNVNHIKKLAEKVGSAVGNI